MIDLGISGPELQSLGPAGLEGVRVIGQMSQQRSIGPGLRSPGVDLDYAVEQPSGGVAESLNGLAILIGGQLVVLFGKRQRPGCKVGFAAVRVVPYRPIEKLLQYQSRLAPEQQQRFPEGDQVLAAQ